MVRTIEIPTKGKGLNEITDRVREIVREADVKEGLCTIFVKHTSASLTIQENADPSAKRDLENWLDKHVPENDPNYTHTSEGPDDMPAHIKSALTSTSLGIPIALMAISHPRCPRFPLSEGRATARGRASTSGNNPRRSRTHPNRRHPRKHVSTSAHLDLAICSFAIWPFQILFALLLDPW